MLKTLIVEHEITHLSHTVLTIYLTLKKKN